MDQNGNYQFVDFLLPTIHSRSILSALYEDRYQHNVVPDINLECDESLDSWDDLQPGIYSPENDEKLPNPGFNAEHLLDGQCSSENEYSYSSSEVVDAHLQSPLLLLQNHFVNDWLQVCSESENIEQPSSEEAPASQESTISSDVALESQESINTSDSQEQQNITDNTYESNNSINSSNESNTQFSQSFSNELEMFQQPLPVYDISSRSSSPPIIEILSNVEHDFANYRSISPLIIRSPSPLSSRSTSPLMFRPPSPLDFLEHSFSELPIDDPSDLMFYEDGYIRRSYSPVLATTDQQVPDSNIEFRQAVNNAVEFPSSFRSYTRSRTLNSCHDQVVPEFIEE